MAYDAFTAQNDKIMVEGQTTVAAKDLYQKYAIDWSTAWTGLAQLANNGITITGPTTAKWTRPRSIDLRANGGPSVVLRRCLDETKRVDDVRASGARVVLVGSCAPGWSADVFDWNADHLESGSASGYQPYPTCDATYGAGVYASQLVRYFEDTTLVSALLNPTRPPVDPEALTPQKVQSMTNCGVNLFGLDQLLPENGRIQASLWSWAPDEPRAGAGVCTLQGADGRWAAASCADAHPAACLAASTWTVTPSPVTFAVAPAACAATGSTFALPQAGDQNARLHAVAGPAGAWVRNTVTS